MYKTENLGKHVIAEFYGIKSELIADVARVENFMNKSAQESNFTIISSHFHQFEPHGVTGVIIISESHMTIHTWPEYGYAAIDVFTCGEKVDPIDAITNLSKYFKPTKTDVNVSIRGISGIIENYRKEDAKKGRIEKSYQKDVRG